MVYLEIRTMDKHPAEKGIADVIRTYELLDKIRVRSDLVIRDDQFDYEALGETIRHSRKHKYRVCLVDTGLLDTDRLEWLIKEGARLYTSDEARPKPEELFPLVRTARRAGMSVSFLQNGALEKTGEAEAVFRDGLMRLLEEGMDLHLTNRIHQRDFALLVGLTEVVAKNRGYMVYYHHGPPDIEMQELAANGIWLHFSDRDIPADGDFNPVLDIVRAASAKGTKTAVHLEKGLALERLESLWDAGAVLLFKTPPSDFASAQKTVERKALRRRLPVRSFYLTTDFLP